MKVIISNTYDIDAYVVDVVSEEEFLRLEELRGGQLWAVLEECPQGSGHYRTYHGPA